MKAVRDLFKKHYSEMEYDLEEPACDFDMYYDGESDWPINHTRTIAPKRGFSWSKAKDMKKKKKATRAPPSSNSADAAPMTCKEQGCGTRGKSCDCNPKCKEYNDCCEDYEDQCPDHASAAEAELKTESGASS